MVFDWVEAVRLAYREVAADAQLGAMVVVVLGAAAVWAGNGLVGLLQQRRGLSDAERGRLALGEPYFTLHGFRRRDLGGRSPLGVMWVRTLLRKDWRIRDGATAIEALHGLAEIGHRADPELADPTAGAEDRRKIEQALLAWDAVRLVFIARCCFAAGYLEAPAVWWYVDQAHRLVGGRFASWAELGTAFVLGRMLWGGDDNSVYADLVDRLAREPRSPWAELSPP